MARVSALILLAALLGGPGCMSEELGAPCEVDEHCDGECTNIGECVAEGSSIRIFLTWTIHGEAPTPDSPEPCQPIRDLEVAFYDGSDRVAAFVQVTCALGQINFQKMPPRLDAAIIAARSSAGGVLHAAEVALDPQDGEAIGSVDLQP